MKSRSHIWANCGNFCHSVPAQALSGYTGGIIDDFKSMSPHMSYFHSMYSKQNKKTKPKSVMKIF